MLNCIGPEQQPKLLTPQRTPGALERPWLDSTLPIPARTCQPSPGQVLAAVTYSARYPAGISPSAYPLTSAVLAVAVRAGGAGARRAVRSACWIVRPTAPPTLARGKPGEARPVSTASSSSAPITLPALSLKLALTTPSSRRRRAAQ